MSVGETSAAVILLLVLSIVAAKEVEAQATWEVSDRPALVIGTEAGPPFSVFHDIRGVVTAEDTLVVVADGESRELRIFNSSGDFVEAFGGRGDGPREFRAIDWVDRCGDAAIVVYDLYRRRVTKWDAQGILLDGFNVESTEPSRPAYALSCGPSEGFAVVGWPDVLSYRVGQGPYRPDTNVGIVGPDGRLEKVLATVPGSERYRYESEGFSDGPRRLGKTTIARMGAGGVFVGTGDSYEIEVFRADGGSFTFGKPQESLEFTREMLEVWQNSLLSRVPPGDRAVARRTLARLEMPETLPAYADFRFDGLGLLWVARFPVPGQNRNEWDVWRISESDGVHIASIQVPRSFQVMEIGFDYLMGVDTDSLGIQRIHRYRLSR
ncbi:MAG: hypothetical protein EA351_01530 [Gemmatimonadales bacterium]|nr:MAG: hypothetical protein EA351_01530 [Gemmatimonadales bacterium]